MLERPVVLTGFMGCGKSSVGRVLAASLGFSLVDLDAKIVAEAGKTIHEIFAERGESGFRVLESECLERELLKDRVVIACGGGVVISAANRRLMRELGFVVNLTASFTTILARLKDATDRPLFCGEDASDRALELMKQREPYYQEADIRIDTDCKSVEDVAAEIQNLLEGLPDMRVLNVHLADHSYDILIDHGSLSALGQRCAEIGLIGNAAVITNPTVAAFYADTVASSLKAAGNNVTVIEIPDGEEYKNATTLNSVYDALIEAGIDRKSFIVALGGGVVGDLAGFAAATFLRGIPFVQVPTTLLAQVDSSVGGKTAIDHPRGKNLIGAFYQPKLVLIDTDTLKTLPEREYRAGLAEVVKYGVICDLPFFEILEKECSAIQAMDQNVLQKVILRCCQLKAQIVEQDEKESGLRAILNYGHTLGHAYETGAGYGTLVHGEAVAIGIALAAHISMSLGHCSSDDVARIEALLNAFKLSFEPPAVERYLLLNALTTDKKVAGGTISFICNSGIGGHIIEKFLPEQLIALAGLEV